MVCGELREGRPLVVLIFHWPDQNGDGDHDICDQKQQSYLPSKQQGYKQEYYNKLKKSPCHGGNIVGELLDAYLNLTREAGLHPAALAPGNTSRPVPRPGLMRGGHTPSGQPYMGSPQFRARADAATSGTPAPVTNQLRDTASMAGELVGTEPLARGVMALRGDYTGRPEPGRAAGEFAMGGLNMFGTLGTLGEAAGAGRVGLRPPVTRPSVRPAPQAPAPMSAFQSLAPGSVDDIMSARQPFMRPEADYAAAHEQVPWQLYHGTNANIDGGALRPTRRTGIGLPEPTGVSTSPNPNIAGDFGRIIPVQVTGRIGNAEDFMRRARAYMAQGMSDADASARVQSEFAADGFRGVRFGNREVTLFDPVPVPPQAPAPMSSAPRWERATDGSVLPVRPQADRPFSRTAATSADLREATQPPNVPQSAAPSAIPHHVSRVGRDIYEPSPGVEMEIAPGGRTLFTYRGRARPGGGAGAEGVRVFRGAYQALLQDIERMRALGNPRPEYSWRPETPRQAELYRNAMRNRAPEGYHFTEAENGMMRLRRQHNNASNNGMKHG